MRNIVVFSGTSHPELSKLIVARLGISLGQLEVSKFANGETNVDIGESVRERDVYIIQTTADPVNDVLFELLLIVHACKIASAARINVVIPCFPYSRHVEYPYMQSYIEPTDPYQRSLLPIFQEAKEELNGYRIWSPRCGSTVADLLTIAGSDHVITMDLHSPQFQGYFDIPVDNLPSLPLMCKCIRDHIPDYKSSILVTPDTGGAKRASAAASALGIDFALIHKNRVYKEGKSFYKMVLVGQVAGRTAILLDDMTDTSDTLVSAAETLIENGVSLVYAVVTHGVFSGNAIEQIQDSPIHRVFVSNTVPQQEHVQLCSKFTVFDVSHMFSEAIRRTHNGESVSFIYNPKLYEN